MSIPNSSNTLAIWIFSSKLIDAPGDCSPSRIVVSKIITLSLPLITKFYRKFILQSISEIAK